MTELTTTTITTSYGTDGRTVTIPAADAIRPDVFHDTITTPLKNPRDIVSQKIHSLARVAMLTPFISVGYTATPKFSTKDNYAPCDCGSGKKFKFCCKPDLMNRVRKEQRLDRGITE